MSESLHVSICVERSTAAVNTGDQCLIWLMSSRLSVERLQTSRPSIRTRQSGNVLCFVMQSECAQVLTCALSRLPAQLPGDCECGLKIVGVSALLLLVWDIFSPAFVLATCCRAGRSLKAGMLAGCGLCIIDADCDWALRAIGYNFEKSKKVVNSGWTHGVFSRTRRRWRLLKPRAERRPDSGDVTSLLVHF